jgi:alpha-2-macroglobulin
MRAIWTIFFFLLLATGAAGEPNLPQIAESASAYRKSIEGLTPDATAAQLLRAIKQAETAGRTAELIRLYERLLAANSDNFRAWLQLGLAWREAEASADKGLAAAFNAYGTAQSAPNQVEALLLASSILRARLEKFRKDYDAAREDFQKAERLLAYLNDAVQKGDVVVDQNDPAGNVRLLGQSRDAAAGRTDEASQQIARVAADLDEIYREIAAKVPGTDPDKMKAGDARSAVFAPILVLGSDQARVDYRIVGNDVHACVEFTQDLRASDLSYRDFIEIRSKDDVPVTGFGVEAKDRVLCVSGLVAGASYKLQIRAGMPSRQGAKLATAVSMQELTLPNLPKQITFSGRHFILPTSGPGEVPVSATNLKDFDLELFRVTDRTLYRHIALGHIGGELPYSEYTELRDRFAERFWSGTVTLSDAAAKTNETVRASLPVRSILQQRSEWLRREISSNRGDQVEASSLPLPISGVAEEKIGVQGRFFAGSLTFESAALDVVTPGVYALLTRDLAPPTDQSEAERTECPDKKKRPGHKEDCGPFLVQWFLDTDIGLTFYEGDRDFTVIARSLRSGEAKVDAKIELVSANNRVLASGVTDGFGVATFARSLTRGTQSNSLVAILAQHKEDFAFLTFGPERLDLSRLNIDGRPITDGFNAFLTTDRGIYQPGETIHVLALIRNPEGVAPALAPKATIRLQVRDRTLVQRRVEPTAWMLGGAALAIEIPRTIRPGSARLTLSLGEGDAAPVVGDTIVQVGPVRPDRARLQFVDPDRSWRVRKAASGLIEIDGTIAAQYLFGSEGTQQGVGRDLKTEVLVKMAAAETPARGCYEGFTFGQFDEKSIPISTREFMQYTDAAGKLKLSLSGIPSPDSTRPTAATIEATVFDAAGPLASRSMTFPIADDGGWIGISKVPRLRPSAKAGAFDLGVDVVAVTGEARGNALLDFRLERERDLYVWERRDNAWQHIKSARRELVATRRISRDRLDRVPSTTQPTDAHCTDALRVPDLASALDVGRYVLTVTDAATGRRSSVRFHAGAAATDADQLEPNIFTLSTDKQTYRPNEEIKITAEVSFDGEVLIAFADGDVRRWALGKARDGVARISVTASPEWVGKGLYALATAFRSNTNGTARAGPARAIGATHFEVKGEQAGYGVALQLVRGAGQRQAPQGAFISPDEQLSFEVCVADATGCSANPPAEAFAAVFVVDEGLLGLTGHHDPVPDPARYFYGRKRFGLRIMDNYDRLLLKEGGDRPTRLVLSNYTSARIVSEARGPVKLASGKAIFTIPRLDLQAGAVTVFAVVWSKDYAAATTAKIGIRSQVVADLDVPGSLLAGDRAVLPLRLENIDFLHEGDFAVRISSSGPIVGVAGFGKGENPPAIAPQAEIRVPLRQNDPKTVYVLIDTAPDGVGKSSLTVLMEPVVSSVPLQANRREWTFDLRPPALASVDTISFPLSRQPINLNKLLQDVIGGAYNPDTVLVTARFSDDPRSLLAASAEMSREGAPPILDHLVWRAMLLLYTSEHAVNAGEQNPEVVRVLGEVLSLQLPNGSFVPYRTLGDFSPAELTFVKQQDEDQGTARQTLLRTAGVLDLMSYASAAGYDIPGRALRSARQFVSTQLARAPSGSDCSFETTYALLVLVGSGSTDVDKGQIDALSKCQFDDPATQAAAAAVATKYGLSDQGKIILARMEDDKDPSRFRDLSDYRRAMMLSFLSEAGAPSSLLDSVADALLTPGNRAALSRAALAWVKRATATSRPRSKLGAADLVIDAAALGPLRRAPNGVLETNPIPYRRLRSMQVSIGTRADIGARAVLTIEGLLTKPREASRLPEGALKRRLFDLETGREVDPNGVGLNIGDRLVVVIEGNRNALPTGAAPDGAHGPILLANLLPSAFQIVSAAVFGHANLELRGALAKLQPRGDLRSVETDSDRWIALIVPESWREKAERGPDGKEPAPDDPLKKPRVTGEDKIEFRQGYLVRVNMAGRFTSPALSLEPTVPPIKTLRAEQSYIEIKLPDASKR